MTNIQKYSPAWPKRFEQESQRIRQSLPQVEDIQHIGSTSIPEMTAKPIVDIAVLIKFSRDAEKLMQPLQDLGYKYFPESSSTERHFFRKGTPVEFHLSLAYQDRGSFWRRQITFRDYLRLHPEARSEYAELKKNLLVLDPTGGKDYLDGKSGFVERILVEAKKS